MDGQAAADRARHEGLSQQEREQIVEADAFLNGLVVGLMAGLFVAALVWLDQWVARDDRLAALPRWLSMWIDDESNPFLLLFALAVAAYVIGRLLRFALERIFERRLWHKILDRQRP